MSKKAFMLLNLGVLASACSQGGHLTWLHKRISENPEILVKPGIWQYIIKKILGKPEIKKNP